jgi:glutathione peroxidase-family protein
VIYRANGRAVWASRAHVRWNSVFVVQHDGNVVDHFHVTPIWSTRTAAKL